MAAVYEERLRRRKLMARKEYKLNERLEIENEIIIYKSKEKGRAGCVPGSQTTATVVCVDKQQNTKVYVHVCITVHEVSVPVSIIMHCFIGTHTFKFTIFNLKQFVPYLPGNQRT
jgi:hypothetical protein